MKLYFLIIVAILSFTAVAVYQEVITPPNKVSFCKCSNSSPGELSFGDPCIIKHWDNNGKLYVDCNASCADHTLINKNHCPYLGSGELKLKDSYQPTRAAL